MNILSLETTSEICSLAFIKDNSVKNEMIFQSSDPAIHLIPNIENILKNSATLLSHVDFIAVSSGPGSWTGIRLGLSVAKGLAKGDISRIYCISATQSVFYSSRQLKLPAICLINAYGGKMFVSYFNGKFYYVRNYYPEKVPYKDIPGICGSKEVLLTGPGITLLPEKIRKMKTVRTVEEYYACPRAGTNGLLAAEKIYRQIPSLPLKPYYGR